MSSEGFFTSDKLLIAVVLELKLFELRDYYLMGSLTDLIYVSTTSFTTGKNMDHLFRSYAAKAAISFNLLFIWEPHVNHQRLQM